MSGIAPANQPAALPASTCTIPGVNIPTIVGPFSVADARVYVSQQIFNWSDIQQLEVGGGVRAGVAAYRTGAIATWWCSAAGNAYLMVISDRASVDSIRAQLTTAQTLHDRAVDQNKAGVIAASTCCAPAWSCRRSSNG